MRIIVFAVALLAGCSVSTQAVRESGKVETIIVPAAYQQVYRQLSTEMRRCLEIGAITASYVVQADLFTDIRRGEIAVKLQGGAGTRTAYVVDVIAIDDATTKVDVYTTHTNDTAGPVRKILDGQKLCDADR